MREFDADDEDIVRLLRDSPMAADEAIERVAAVLPLGLSLQDVADALAMRRFQDSLDEHWMWMASRASMGHDGAHFLVHASDARRTDGVGSVRGTGTTLAEAADACRDVLRERLGDGWHGAMARPEGVGREIKPDDLDRGPG